MWDFHCGVVAKMQSCRDMESEYRSLEAVRDSLKLLRQEFTTKRRLARAKAKKVAKLVSDRETELLSAKLKSNPKAKSRAREGDPKWERLKQRAIASAFAKSPEGVALQRAKNRDSYHRWEAKLTPERKDAIRAYGKEYREKNREVINFKAMKRYAERKTALKRKTAEG